MKKIWGYILSFLGGVIGAILIFNRRDSHNLSTGSIGDNRRRADDIRDGIDRIEEGNRAVEDGNRKVVQHLDRAEGRIDDALDIIQRIRERGGEDPGESAEDNPEKGNDG